MKKDILVVDDELDQRDYLKALLEDHGYSVRTAADGLEAMQRVKEATPDLVLLDLQMPDGRNVAINPGQKLRLSPQQFFN